MPVHSFVQSPMREERGNTGEISSPKPTAVPGPGNDALCAGTFAGLDEGVPTARESAMT
ncbi:MAG TPA: hypothetical protein VG389_09785 [Myxococcota bacterium]|jgi:hypothetical protein|nr:hypothetical protein [Myxococcota bacterium]